MGLAGACTLVDIVSPIHVYNVYFNSTYQWCCVMSNHNFHLIASDVWTRNACRTSMIFLWHKINRKVSGRLGIPTQKTGMLKEAIAATVMIDQVVFVNQGSIHFTLPTLGLHRKCLSEWSFNVAYSPTRFILVLTWLQGVSWNEAIIHWFMNMLWQVTTKL